MPMIPVEESYEVCRVEACRAMDIRGLSLRS
jgi:hypothetical protein